MNIGYLYFANKALVSDGSKHKKNKKPKAKKVVGAKELKRFVGN